MLQCHTLSSEQQSCFLVQHPPCTGPHLLTKVTVRVLRNRGSGVEAHSQFPQEISCERVTVHDLKGPGVQHHLLVDVEMVHVVELVIIWMWERNPMAPDQGSCDGKNFFFLNSISLFSKEMNNSYSH